MIDPPSIDMAQLAMAFALGVMFAGLVFWVAP